MGDKLRIYDRYGVLQEYDPVDAAGANAFTADQSMGGFKLTSVAAPVSDGDVLSKGDAVLVGTEVAVVADDNVIGGIPVLHRMAQAAGSNADFDITLTHKERVIDAWIVLAGAGVGSAVITVKNAGNAITDGMAASGSDKAVIRAGEIDDAQHEIAAAGTLRITTSGGATGPEFIAYVLCVRVA